MYYRTTHKGHKVAWDEPSQDVEDRIAAHIRKTLQDRQARAAKARLKLKSAVPTKDGQPIFEGAVSFMIDNSSVGPYQFRQANHSCELLNFKQWQHVAKKYISGK